MQTMTLEIDGDVVRAEQTFPDDDPFNYVSGLQLIGSKRYDGHLHGTFRAGEYRICLPNVVDSQASFSDVACGERPFNQPCIYAIWLNDGL